MEWKLLASSSSVEGIQGCINKFFLSKNYLVDLETLKISNPELPDKNFDNFRVIKKRNRYRFEHLSSR